MKKNFLLAGSLLVMTCGVLTYCFASSSEPSTANEATSKNEIVSSVIRVERYRRSVQSRCAEMVERNWND